MPISKEDIATVARVIAAANGHPAPDDYVALAEAEFDAIAPAEEAPKAKAAKAK